MAAGVAVASFGASVYSGYQQHQAGKAGAKAAKANAIMGAMNAGREAAMARYDAEETRRVGALNAELVMAQASEFQGAQQVIAAASGFVSDGGTVDILKKQTENLARTDALAMLLDASQQAVSLEVGAENLIKTGTSRALAEMNTGLAQANAMQSQALGTILGGAVQFAGTKTGQGLYNTVKAKVSDQWNLYGSKK